MKISVVSVKIIFLLICFIQSVELRADQVTNQLGNILSVSPQFSIPNVNTAIIEKTNMEEVFSPEKISPQGQFYEVTVPDTLDLAERASLAVCALTRFLNPITGYGPYGHAFFKVQPPYMTERMYYPNMDAGLANWGKVMEALVILRTVCGSDLNLNIESASLKEMMKYVKRSGCSYQNSRALMTLMALYQQKPTPELKQLIEDRINNYHSDVTYEGNYAYFDNPPPELENTDMGIFNYEHQTHQNGYPIWALCLWYEINGNPRDLELAGKISNFLSQYKFWEPEAEPKFFVGKEHAHFMGHVHSYQAALLGLLQYAKLTNNARLKEFVREGYEYIRNIGIARIGLFGETCTIAEMVILAVELSEMGVGDYWDHVDQYVRNHLIEMQIVNHDLIENSVSRMPKLNEIPKSDEDEDLFSTREDCVEGRDTTYHMIERNIGTFFTDGGHPAKIPRRNLTWTICCVANAAKGLYFAWRGIIQYDEELAKINLLLNRSSACLDIDSYLPYEGKVVIKNKTARKIAIRIPGWVDKKSVTSKINENYVSPYWVGNYLMIEQVNNSDVITIEFPIEETTEVYTLKWKQTDRWFESNWPQKDWETGNDQYTCYFKGNTLVEISPMPDGLGYPLFKGKVTSKIKHPLKQ